MRGLYGIAVTAAIILAVVWAYNRFSEKNISQLGVKTDK